MLETLGKYIIENHRDFYDAIQYLKENNVQPIKFNLNNDTENHHNKILIDFFKIDKKNKIENINLIFYNAKIEKKFYTTFPLSELTKIQKIKKDDYKQTEILFTYIKTPRYTKEMIEPLKQTILINNTPFIHLNTSRNKQTMTIYKYFNTMNSELKVIETNQVSKNPLYGLVHYINLSPYSFQNKYLVLQELKTITIDKNEFKTIKDFFNIIESKNYTFILNIKGNEDNSINLSFNQNEVEENYKQILTFENFNIKILLNIFKDFYNFEELLKYLHLNKINIHFYDDEDIIKVLINNISFEFEKDSKLIRKFLKDFISDYIKKTLFQKIIYYLRHEYYINEKITVEDYFNYCKQKNIIYTIKERIK